MSRSDYSEDCDNLELYRASVERAIRGKRGQSFLRTLAKEMDAMPEKALYAGELISPEGECCAIGVVCKALGIDVSRVDYFDRGEVAALINIAPSMAAEIVFENDDDFNQRRDETPEQRWIRMRKWVSDNLMSKEAGDEAAKN